MPNKSFVFNFLTIDNYFVIKFLFFKCKKLKNLFY